MADPTPPNSHPISCTPRKRTSASSFHSHEPHSVIDYDLDCEIAGSIEYNVRGYLPHLLLPSDPARRRALQRHIRSVLARVDTLGLRSNNQWSGCTDYNEAVFAPQLATLWTTLAAQPQQPLPGEERGVDLGVPHTVSDNRTRPLSGSIAERRPDLLMHRHSNTESTTSTWEDVLAFIELKGRKRDMTVATRARQMAGYGREVLHSQQPYRSFVNAIYFMNHTVWLWRLDRRGALVSMHLDFHRDWKLFVTVVLSFLFMDSTDLGYHPAYHWTDAHAYTLRYSGAEYTVGSFLFRMKALAGRATACYESQKVATGNGAQTPYVIKQSWRQRAQLPEERIYKIAHEKKVAGLLKLEHGDLRERLLTVNRDVRRGCCGESRPDKRKSTSQPAGQRRSKVSRSCKSSTQSRDGGDSACPSESEPLERENDVGPESDRLDMGPVDENARELSLALDEKYILAQTTLDENRPDRVFTLLVFRQGIGAPLHTIQSPRRLFEVILSAMRVHRDLYKTGLSEDPVGDDRVLHRDISVGNILATTPTTELTRYCDDPATYEKPAGFLIDFDNAITMQARMSGAAHRTGTDAFVAVSVLEGALNSYRADLESFFYVICWVCTRYPSDTAVGLPLHAAKTTKTKRDCSSSLRRPSSIDSATQQVSLPPLEDWNRAPSDQANAASKRQRLSSPRIFETDILGRLSSTHSSAATLLEALRTAVVDSDWFTRDRLIRDLARRQEVAAAAQVQWERDHPGVSRDHWEVYRQCPLAKHEAEIVAEEDEVGDKLYEEMVTVIRNAVDGGVLGPAGEE